MAQTATNPKIEELRARIKADPKSRLFYQLAEELRRNGQAAEAEQILRSGLSVHPTYLAAWVSLGRVCRELKNDRAAVDALVRALQLDPGNVVAARLLGDAHLALGDKVEAIKKYKLVYALLPADEELEGIIERLDRELHPPAPSAEPLPGEAEGAAPQPVTEPQPALPEEVPSPAGMTAAFEEEPGPAAFRPEPPAAGTEPPSAQEEESPFDKTQPPFAEASSAPAGEVSSAFETADAEPMLRAHEESPFEEPAGGYTAASAEIESIPGISIEPAPLQTEVPARAGEAFATPEAGEPEAFAAGTAPDETSAILSDGLEGRVAEPETGAAERGSGAVRIARLERWLARVSRKEARV